MLDATCGGDQICCDAGFTSISIQNVTLKGNSLSDRPRRAILGFT